MSVTAIITIILAVFGMISGIIFNFYRTNRILKENEFIKVINYQRADINAFKSEIKILHDKVENLNSLIRELDSALLRSNAISLAFPFPFWYKSSDGRMRLLNDEYCKTFKKCREDYIGKTDFEVWDEEKAKLFEINDKSTLLSQLGYNVYYSSEVEDSIVIKWRIPGLTKEESYIAGIAVPYKILNDVRTTG